MDSNGITIDPKTYPGSYVEVETAAEALLRLFQYNDVDHIFMSPGTEWRALWDAIERARGGTVDGR
jgi:hypothetical protein